MICLFGTYYLYLWCQTKPTGILYAGAKEIEIDGCKGWGEVTTPNAGLGVTIPTASIFVKLNHYDKINQ